MESSVSEMPWAGYLRQNEAWWDAHKRFPKQVLWITFEEIREVAGLTEAQVIRLMRRTLKPSSFRLWRKRATSQSIKHRKRFQRAREAERDDAWRQWSHNEE